MATIPGRFVNDSGVTELEGSLVTDQPVNADTIGGVAINNTPTTETQMLSTVDTSNAAWGSPIIAAAVPVAAPVAGELGIAVDTTAVTGGIYIWDATGNAWVKAATI